MGVSVLGGDYEGAPAAVLVCNTSDQTFGPLFPSADAARRFLVWLNETYCVDPRDLALQDELEEKIDEFNATQPEARLTG